MSNIKKENIFEKVKSIIHSYIEKKETDYAILLNGDWGCGKTYFIEKILKKELKEYKLVYISTAGITDITEFINDIYLTKASEKISNKHTLGAMKAVSKYIGTATEASIFAPLVNTVTEMSKDIGKNIINFSNTLIVIDDLERISETIKIEDFLYRIYDTFISQNVKVLFVANEEEIKKNSNYEKIKEKIIRHTIDLYDIENIKDKQTTFENIIDSITKDNNKNIEKYFIDECFFKSNIDGIKKIFLATDCNNIRVFLKYLDLAEDIFSIDERLKEKKEIFNEILLLLAITLIELESDNKEKIENLVKNDNYSLTEISNKIETGTECKYKTKATPDVNNYIKQLKNTYNKYITNNICLVKNNNIFDVKSTHEILKIFITYINTSFLNKEKIKYIYDIQLKLDEHIDKASNIFLNSNTYEIKEIEKSIKILNEKIQKEPLYFDLKYLYTYYKNYKYCSHIGELDKSEILNAIEKNIIEITDNIKSIRELNECEFNLQEYTDVKEIETLIKKNIEERKNELIGDFEDKLLKSFQEKTFNDVARNEGISLDEIIFEKDFLNKIEATPYSMTMLKDMLENIEDKTLFENIEEYVNGLDYNSYDIHLQKQIDALKEEIEKAKEHLEKTP